MAPAAWPQAVELHWARAHSAAATAPATVAQVAQVPQVAPAAQPFQPAAETTPGPVFSWRAFIADQAIAVMAYLGGFLLLIATLTFEVSG